MAVGERRLFIGTNEDGQLALGGPWAIAEIKGVASILRGTANTTAALLVPGDENRKAVMIRNMSLTVTVWLGFDASVNASTGYPLDPGADFMDNISTNPWWVYAASSAAVAAVVV